MPQQGEEEKPHGNVFYTPGTKTPRRVQWLDKDPVSSTHSLDEGGLDPAAFQRLTHALEHHKTSLTSRVHHYPPQPEPAHTMDISELGSVPRIPSNINSSHIRPSTAALSGTSSPPSPSSLSSPYRDVPGNYIEATERAGLPGKSDVHQEAERVVNSHTDKRLVESKSKTAKRFNRNRLGKKVEPINESTDVEREADVKHPQLKGGVLSTLLSLYDEETDLMSGYSTPASLDEPNRPWLCSTEDGHRHQSPYSERGIMSDSPSLSRQSTLLGTEAKEAKAFSPSSLLQRHKKPKTRSGAGVFGPLIAATGNLSGVAAPVQSQLQPDVKRPGYRLSRYSYEDKPKYSMKLPSRPQSTYRDDMSSYAPSLISVPSSPPSPTASDPGVPRPTWIAMLKNPSVTSLRSLGGRSGTSTPARSTSPMLEEDGYSSSLGHPVEGRSWKEKKRKRKRAAVFITRHVANILERQGFILKFARAMMMFGAPSHRLQSQLTSTARVLDIEMSCVYLPDVLLISFDDSSTSTSNIKIIRQGSALDIVKLADAYKLYWKVKDVVCSICLKLRRLLQVIHDKLSVSDASAELDNIMRRPQLYNRWKLVCFGGMCSSAICTVSFDGSLIDALVVFPMGALLIVVQLLSSRNELYSNVFEVTISTLFSFLAAALAASRRFCYSAVASSSVVLILPGFLVLNGALELMSRNIVAGSVRLCYAVMYALFLGFGLALGAEAFTRMTGTQIIGSNDVVCSISHYDGAPWFQQKPSRFWAFLTVPMFSLFISLRNQAPYNRIELPLLVGIACIGWVTNHFTGIAFGGQNNISSAVGAFAVGIVANLYARFFGGNAFVVMITGILFQLPSGLGSGGLLNYVTLQTQGDSNSYLSGFQTALLLISVGIELTVGLGISLVIMHPIQSKRRAAGIFSL